VDASKRSVFTQSAITTRNALDSVGGTRVWGALSKPFLRGRPISTFVLLFNACHEPMTFSLSGKQEVSWERVIDTRGGDGSPCGNFQTRG